MEPMSTAGQGTKGLGGGQARLAGRKAMKAAGKKTGHRQERGPPGQ